MKREDLGSRSWKHKKLATETRLATLFANIWPPKHGMAAMPSAQNRKSTLKFLKVKYLDTLKTMFFSSRTLSRHELTVQASCPASFVRLSCLVRYSTFTLSFALRSSSSFTPFVSCPVIKVPLALMNRLWQANRRSRGRFFEANEKSSLLKF